MAATSIPDASSALAAVVREAWEGRLAEDPLLATSVGDPRSADRLPHVAPADFERRAKTARATLLRLRAIDRVALPVPDRISRDMLERELSDEAAEVEFGAHLMPITSEWGPHAELAQLPSRCRLGSAAELEAYLARLRAIPAYLEESTTLLREGLRRGLTPPRSVLGGVEASVVGLLPADPADSGFFAPLRELPATWPEAERRRLREAGLAAVRDEVLPAYRRYLEFLRTAYLPGARTSTGASELPGGAAFYAYRVRRFTTLDLTPQQVHEQGLAEVARIQAEMEAVKQRAGFTGSLPEFIDKLRSEPRFYAKTPDELLQRAALIAKRMDGQLPRLFGRLPRLPYGIEPVPDAIAPHFTGGRYIEPPADGTRAGMYWVNTHALPSRPLYVLEALTLHEAVPGHHLQIALQRELSGLPEFRRMSEVTAFVEGWALYAERLGLEAGFYQDPYADFGRLTYEMWRACRLVVDTGLHAFGWSRERARDYLAAHTALALHEVETETDRYVSWPGQALAYKTGELKIRELRARAERELGPRFDLRAFHDAVLENGPLPLDVLEERILAWIATRRAQAGS
jgi:uncharacterized protein (DUF885 family)